MRAAFLLLLVFLIAGCAPPAPAPDFGCPPVAGAETIAGRRYILIDGGAEAADAAAAIACLAAQQRRVIVAAGPDVAAALAARLNTVRARGGAVQVFTLDAPPADAASARSREERDRLSGEARNDAFARAAAEARDAADAIILVRPRRMARAMRSASRATLGALSARACRQVKVIVCGPKPRRAPACACG